jgi:hypothetical protein
LSTEPAVIDQPKPKGIGVADKHRSMSTQNTIPVVVGVSDPDKLPNQLMIKNGRVVLISTGEPPLFPEKTPDGILLEGRVVVVVPRCDLHALMKANGCRKVALEEIKHLVDSKS